MRSAYALPLIVAELAMASWEVVFRRSLMMAQGTCTAAEYQRMVAEKVTALQASALAAARGHSHAAMLAPFVTRSRANVRRLRRST
jgi:hypothetical protein